MKAWVVETYNGKEWKWDRHFQTRREAREVARQLRREGHSVRVIQYKPKFYEDQRIRWGLSHGYRKDLVPQNEDYNLYSFIQEDYKSSKERIKSLFSGTIDWLEDE